MPTIEEYEKGHTPNPDVLCNHHVKFDALYDKCKKLVKNEDFVLATGHYAKTSLDSSIFELNTLKRGNISLVVLQIYTAYWSAIIETD